MNRFRLFLALTCSLAVGAIGLHSTSVQAQTSPIDIRIATQASTRPVGGLITAVTVVNNGAEPLTNVQLVIRVPSAPALVQVVTETSAPFVDSNVRVGVVDEKTGSWYHTVGSVPVGVNGITFNVNWFNPCAGRWPFAVRANDKRSSTLLQFTGTSPTNCGPDDLASPTPSSWYDLPWPPSILPTTLPPATIATIPGASTSTTIGGTIPGASSSTPGPTVTTIAGSTIPGGSGVSTTTTSTVPATRPVTKPPTTKPPTTLPKPTTTKRPGTTLEIVCKTVGGRRYCGPKSSALKPGQQKPRTVPPSTKKKTKSKK